MPRLLDLGAWLLGAGLVTSLIVSAGRPALLLLWWSRPEHVFLALLVVLSVRWLVAPAAIPRVHPWHTVVAGVLAYALFFSFVTLTRHFTFHTHALDLGYYVQLTWNLARGAGPYVSVPEMHAWGDHFSPIMYGFVPLFWLWPGPTVLLIVQSVALALGAFAVFALARRMLSDERPAAAFAVLYLVNPSLHGINVRDFHAAALAIPLLLAAIYFAEANRPWPFLLAVALALMCREDAALAVVGLGAWLCVARGRWRWGVPTALAGLVLLVWQVQWLIPGYRGEPYSHLGRYGHLGTTLTGVLTGMLWHPLRTAGFLLSGDRLVYLIAMLAPLGLLPLLGPGGLLGAVPTLVQNLLSSDPILYNYRTQYQAFALPFLILAAIEGYKRVAARQPARWPVMVLVVAMVASLALASRTVNNLALGRWWPTSEQRAAYRVMAQVPPAAALSAQDPYVAHLSLRPRVYVFPVGIDKADYVLINAATYPWRSEPGLTMEREAGTILITVPGRKEYRYEVVRHSGPHLLLRRMS